MDYRYKAGPPDALTDVLRTLRLNSRVFSYSEMSAPWALELPPSLFAYFHIVERNGGWLRLNDTQLGSEIMITRLTDLIFVQALRAWLATQPKDEGGWLGALKPFRQPPIFSSKKRRTTQ